MKELHLKYKKETGLSPFIEVESELMEEPIDVYLIEHESKKSILNIIDMNQSYSAIKIDNIDHDLLDVDDLKVYRKGYVEWLEEQLETNL